MRTSAIKRSGGNLQPSPAGGSAASQTLQIRNFGFAIVGLFSHSARPALVALVRAMSVPKTQAPNGGVTDKVNLSALFVEMVFPEQANHYGTLFGGTALSLMAKAAYVAASRFTRRSVVMASSDKVDFHTPVKVGQLIELEARVVRAGRTSLTVDVFVSAETLDTGERRLAMRGRFEMVAVDEAGRPTPHSKQP